MQEHEAQRAIYELKRLFKRDNDLNRHEQGEILSYLASLGLIVQSVITIPDEWWSQILKGEDEDTNRDSA